MIDKILEQLNPWWSAQPIDNGILRTKYLDILNENRTNKEVIFLLGSRRVGKTTIMKQWVGELITKYGVQPKQILYVLLDHPELDNYSISQIIETARTLAGEVKYVLLDEIQYRSGWDQELKALYETQKMKFVISGSAITVLSKQKSYLTGRYLKYIVHSLNFTEFQQFSAKKTIQDYLTIGGYPEYVLRNNPQYLLDLIDHIVYKDIVEVYGIRHPKAIADLLLILARSVGHKISLSKISRTLQISIDTVKEYIQHLEEVYLIHEVPKFSRSLNEQLYNEKKYYFYDTGLCSVLNAEQQMGALAENAVANYLKKQQRTFFYYYANKRECDFVIEQFGGVAEKTYTPIESKFDPEGNSIEWDDKRLSGFYEAIDKLHPEHASIITSKQHGEKKYGHTSLDMISLEVFLSAQ
ncbi:MAG: ATP-binding protein [Candidatus Kerfeldbacteria bacterium]|nr:ATP-binding protein [Candidatus Kerfeldbacteria bacterium]